MNFDFDNLERYISSAPSAEALAMVDKIDKTIGDVKLGAYDTRFMESIKKRVLAEKLLTEKQKEHLAKVLSACKAGTYIIKDFRTGYNKRKGAVNTDVNITI